MSNKYNLSHDCEGENIVPKASTPSWFRPDVDPVKIRELMTKSDGRALMDTLIWLASMVFFAALGVLLWPSWWSIPFWLAYGVLYGSASDSRWHECGHKTAFKTAWMNNVVYHIASFMLIRSPVVWRASHIRHHTDTIVVGRDPEIVAMRPPDLLRVTLNFFGILDAYNLFKRMLYHASGQIDHQEAVYLREHDYSKVFLVARIWVLIYINI